MTAHKQRVAQEMYRSGQYTVATIAKTALLHLATTQTGVLHQSP
jgi:hypothetical protein